ncbi:MAG TPA: SIR2 family protein [Candidatus Acidoferrales bacterium]|nr:SIR2 family protein [Candidatus Acidoferrales bacterium]
MDNAIGHFIDTFVREMAEDNVALFAGAGLSVVSGTVDWKALIAPLAAQLGLDVDKEHDLVSLAQYHYNEHQRHALNQRLITEFSRGHAKNENHEILARLPIRTFWTTNYDRLIETALTEAGRIPDVKYTVKHFVLTRPKRDAIVYKMHGDMENPDDAVLIKDDYERYFRDRGSFVNALSGDLVSKTFLFLGLSFTDPNLDYILSRVRINFSDSQRQHYYITKRREHLPGESEDVFRYASLQQEFAIKDLKRFNIQTLLVDRYDEVTAILRTIESRYRQRTVLISGSAHEYGDFPNPWDFMQGLSRALIQNEYKIVSGFGLGVGSDVITGALQQIYQTQGQSLHDQLILRPFPQGEDAQKQWESYRQDMVAHAGIAIFIFGNKLGPDGSGVLPATGVRREFEIARARNLQLIPIGATGFIAAELWQEVMNDFDGYYPGSTADFKQLFASLGDSSRSGADHISAIIKLLSHIKRNH